MEKFTIEVGDKYYFTAEPSKKLIKFACELSAFYHEKVTIHAFARIRRIYSDGKLISSNPELSKFYTEVSTEDQWFWSFFGEVKD
jgi:hypothetical protein